MNASQERTSPIELTSTIITMENSGKKKSLKELYEERNNARQTYYAAKEKLQRQKREGIFRGREYYDKLNELKRKHVENMDRIFDEIRGADLSDQ